jgi:hypothetical protein
MEWTAQVLGGTSTLNPLLISLFEKRQDSYLYPPEKGAETSSKRLVSIYQTTVSKSSIFCDVVRYKSDPC